MANYTVVIRASLDTKGLEAAERRSKSAFDRISAEAQKAAQRELKVQRDLQRAVESLQRQRSAALIAAFNREQREEQRSIRERERAFKAAEREKQKAAEQAMQRQAAIVETGTRLIVRAYQVAKAAIIATFVAITGAAVGLGLALKSAVTEAVRVQNAFKGLSSVATFKGIAGKDAEDAVRNLRFVRGGMISIGDAATGLKNLLASGFGLKESTALLEAFSDSAAFGKQEALSYGDAIRSATEGIKNQNSILVDNVGITKNLSVILKERGFALEDLSDKVKGAAAREALYQGILAETAAQTGDADKVMAGFAGRMAALEQGWLNLKIAVGQYVTSIPFVTESFETITKFINRLVVAFPDFANTVRDEVLSVYNALPESTKAAFGDMLNTVQQLGGETVEWFRKNYPLIKDAVVNVLNQIARFWQAHGDEIKTLAKLVFNSIAETARLALLVLSGDWQKVWQSLNGILKNESSRILASVNLFLELIQGAILVSGKTIGKIAYALGLAIAEGVASGLKDGFTAKVLPAIHLLAKGPVATLKHLWDQRSPSRVFMQIGLQAMEGLRIGFEQGGLSVERAMALTATRVRRVAESLTRERRVPQDLGGGSWFLPQLEAGRERRVTPEATRARVINPIDLQIAQTYGDILGDLNAELLKHIELSQVEIVTQRLQAAGLDDLSDSRAQEAIQLATVIDQREALNQSRSQIADWASEVAGIFGDAVYRWDATFKGFFKSIARGFLDLFRNTLANIVQNTIFKGAQSLLTRIFLPNAATTTANGGGFFSNIRNVLTGGFGGGPGGGGFLGNGGSISVPASTSATSSVWARLGQTIGWPGQGSTGATAAAPGILGSLTSSIPFLGAAFGIQSLITSFSGTQSNFEAATGGGILGFLINRNARRRREETIRNELSHQTGTAIWALIARAQRGEVTISQARAEWNAIEAAYREGVAQLRDSKTRRHAELQWTNDFAPLWSKVEANARQGEAARAFSSQFVPTFARGGVFGSDFFMPRAARGLMELPGAFDRRDDLLMRVSRGERVAVMTPDQFDRIGGRRTFEAAGVPALATGGSSAPMTSSSSGKGDIVIQTNSDAAAALLRILLEGMKSSDGRKIVVDHVLGDFDSERSDGILGQVDRYFRR